MGALAHPSPELKAGTGTPQGAPVPSLFWMAALPALAAAMLGLPLDQPLLLAAAALLTLLGGIPHGAFDIALARRLLGLDARQVLAAFAAYVGVAAAMGLLWLHLPHLALPLFLLMAAAHFGEDWTMLEQGLLRAMAGASVIAASAIGQPQAVAALFELLAGGPEGRIVAQAAVAAAPVTLLVTMAGIGLAWRDGHRAWALAQATAIGCLLATPPAIGFFLYFTLLHSPLHLSGHCRALADWSLTRLWTLGAAMAAGCTLAVVLLGDGWVGGDPAALAADGFRLLSILAAPHLLLSIVLERHCQRQGRR